MKNILIILLLFLTFTKGYSQKTELKICLNTGLFSFTGNAAAINTYIYSSQPFFIGTNNPYGKKSGVSGGLSLNLQRVFKENIIFGMNPIARISVIASAELLRQFAIARVHSVPTNEGR